MENISAVTSFILMAYTELEDYRYVYFTCLLFLYVMILFVNSVLFLVIYIERGLHGPMYLFICNLSLNGVYGSTVLLPSMLGHLLLANYEVSVTNCLLQAFFLYSYGSAEFTILAVMAYDRYAAICHPLHYNLLMSHRRVYVAIALSWIIPFIYHGLYCTSIVGLSFCDRHVDKVYCSSYHLQTLSCFDSSVENFAGMALLAVCPGLPFVLILFSYAHILRICLFASRESKIKALQTCAPHLVTVVNYTFGVSFELIYSLFTTINMPSKARIFMSIYFLIITPLCNPLIYGVSIQAIRVQISKLFVGEKSK